MRELEYNWRAVTHLIGMLTIGCSAETGGAGQNPSPASDADAATVNDSGTVQDGASASDTTAADTTAADTTASDSATPTPDSSVEPVDAATPKDGGSTPVDADGATDGGSGTKDSGSGQVDGGGGQVDSGGGQKDTSGGQKDTSGGQKDTTGGFCVVGAPNVCGEKHYCAGVCGEKGVCKPKPEGCITLYSPVCGCDNKTHSNSCVAASKGVSVKSKGACPSSGGCKTANDCADANACTVDTCDMATGKCSNKAAPGGSACNDGNACTVGDNCMVAAGAPPVCMPGKLKTCTSADKCKLGVCQPATGKCTYTSLPGCGSACGGKMGLTCPKGKLCDYLMCGADILGVCVDPAKQPCPKTTPAAQVCGCDGKTYANDCLRKVSKVGLKHKGACVAVPLKCSVGPVMGPVGAECAKAQYCKLPLAGACVGYGTCVNKPQVCTKELKPICGCDDKTYSNTCLAAYAGKNVKSPDKCGGGGDKCLTNLQCNDKNNCTLDTCVLGVCKHAKIPNCGVLPGCCKAEADCKGGLCVGTVGTKVCKTTKGLGAGECWTDARCGGVKCLGAIICPCGAMCIIADKPGKCDGGGINNKCSYGAIKGPQGKICAKNEYCMLPLIGLCAGYGDCVAKPEMCIALAKPVCGCDGKTYGNSCKAAGAGHNVKTNGMCGIK